MLGVQPAAGNPFFIYSHVFIELRLRALLCPKWTFGWEGAETAQDRAWRWSASVFLAGEPGPGSSNSCNIRYKRGAAPALVGQSCPLGTAEASERILLSLIYADVKMK